MKISNIITYKKYFSFNVFILFSILIYFIYLVPANSNLSVGVYQLFMDEQISFDEIYKIIHSNSLLDLLRNVIGGDQRYGRIIYYITSIFCYIPAKYFGATGQIISVRMIFAITLILSYYYLTITFIKNKILSFILFVCLICIPTTSYYATMPKPEPFSLLFLALFLFFHTKKNGIFGLHYILLGLSFGAKISIISAIPFIFIYSIYTEKNNYLTNYYKLYFNFIKSFFFFLLGFFIAVPIIPLSLFKHSLFKLYLYSTFLGSSHGSDDISVNIFVWIKDVFTNWVNAPLFLSIGIFGLTFFIIGNFFIKSKLYFIKNNNVQIISLFILCITLTFPILLLVKRVWFFYLHIGIVFYIILLFYSIENGIYNRGKFYFISIFLFSFYSLIFMFNDQIKYLKQQQSRTESLEYENQNKTYQYILKTLNGSIKNKKRISLYYSPHFYRLDDVKFDIIMVWNYFDSWQEGRDYIFLSKANNPKISKPLITNANYKNWENSALNYDKFVNQNKNIPSYVEIISGIDGLYVFKRIR